MSYCVNSESDIELINSVDLVLLIKTVILEYSRMHPSLNLPQKYPDQL